ncbi:MAG: ZIP family metal transporter [Christensenellales bacterium]|jgi:ZIP family zinc transporter
MYLKSTIIGCIVGASGTLLGGILAMLIGKKVMAPRPFLAFAGGMMVAVVFFDMLIESVELGGIVVMAGGTVIGGVLFAMLSPFFSHKEEHTLYSTGMLVLIGIAFHNLPEGLAIGSALVESEHRAFSLSLLMLVHDIPEGVAVCLPFRLSGMSFSKMLWLAFLTGMPTALGSVLGTAVGTISQEMIALCISFAGGAMLYISLKELIPAAGKKNRMLYALLGLGAGFIMTTFI